MLEASLGPAPFSPGNVDGRRDSLALGARFAILPLDGIADLEIPHGTDKTFFIEWDWSIAPSGGGPALRTLHRSEPIVPPFVRQTLPDERGHSKQYIIVQSSQAWDGRDLHNMVVPDGSYAFRINARSIRVGRDGTKKKVLDSIPEAQSGASVDDAPPAIIAGAVPPPNASGWNSTNVTVGFDCKDEQSGISVCPTAVTISTEGAQRAASGTAQDIAGNQASVTVLVNLDRTNPSLAISSPTTGTVVSGSPVAVHGTATDALSGLAGVTCNGAPAAVDAGSFSCDVPLTPGANSIVVTATDLAGNVSTSTIGLTLTVGGAIGTTTVTPSSASAGVPLTVLVTASITDPSLIDDSATLERIGSGGNLLSTIGTLHDDGLNGDVTPGDFTFSLSTTVYENAPGTVTFRVSALFGGSDQRVYSDPVTVNVTGIATSVTILTPATGAYLNLSPVTVSGTVGDPAAQVTINGISAPVSGTQFVATVPLNEGPNTLTAVATNSNGTTNTSSIQVSLDTTPPHVAIYTPTDNTVTTDNAITVTGLVNDIVVGTVNPEQATVRVNGVAAEVINRTFAVSNIPLALGQNTIQAAGVDRAGNGVTVSITVTRQAPTQPTLRVLTGSGQSGLIRTFLPAPLVAQLRNGSGQPVPNTPVVFRVINQDGTVSPVGEPGANLSATAVNTDSQGVAAVRLTLGSHAGAGNNVVEASTTGVASTAVFTASALPTAAGLIIVDTGNNQQGVIGQPLPLPFVAVVTDAGYNRLGNIPVTFTVKSGAGSFNGSPTFQTTSDSDGRVLATLTLGSGPGVNNNVVEGTFEGNAAAPVAFTASGLTPGPADATRISGVVLDNSNAPIPGVTMRLFQINQGNRGNIPQQVATEVQTDAQGQFVMQPVPVGVFKLMADGGTAQRLGTWPTIEYDVVTVPGQNNTLGVPVYLPELLPSNRLCVSETTGGTLTIPQAPGFALTIAAGSATFPGGGRTGCVSVTPVNMDKVPMSPGFGQQPRFVVTIQPVGTNFSPPAAITLPNVDGLAPRGVTEMYSYDHDLASFVAIGTGTVSEDGSVVRSDPGVGVLKAGWHCGGNPTPTGSAGTCQACQRCEGSGCIATTTPSPCDDTLFCTQNDRCQNGACTGTPVPPTTGPSVSIAVNLNEAFTSVKGFLRTLFGSGAPDFELQLAGSKGSTNRCCERTRSTVTNKTAQLAGTAGVQGEFPIPGFSLTLPFSLGEAGLFATAAISVSGTLGAEADNCLNSVTGSLGGQFQLTGGIEGRFDPPANVLSIVFGGSTGATCAIVGSVTAGQISGEAGCGHNGLIASATVELLNGTIEVTGSVVLIEPATLAPVQITVPFTM